MDKYEYKLKLSQIKNLVGQKDYQTAAEIADSVNWKKEKNVSTLCMVAKIYEKIKQYEVSRDILLIAYDRALVGRQILFRLTQIAIKMKSFDEAEDYYEEFLEYAPHDNMRYVLKYEIAKGKGADIKERIAILEEFKLKEYTEEWVFELAYLYHKAGNFDKCVEICDEVILWFGEGRYVEKALELKMIYKPLNKMQEEKYSRFIRKKEGIIEVRSNSEPESEESVKEDVKIPKIEVNPSQFNTQNLQEELAKSMQQIINATEKEVVADTMDNIKKMVKEIPYLYMPSMEEQINEARQAYGTEEADTGIDGSLQIDFKKILAEDYDGQISLFVPDEPNREPQIHGQMSIEDVLAEWEKTKRAAEETIAAVEKKKLESAISKALQQTEGIMEQLADMDPSAEMGILPEEIPMEKKSEEILIAEEPEEIPIEEELEEISIAEEPEEIPIEEELEEISIAEEPEEIPVEEEPEEILLEEESEEISIAEESEEIPIEEESEEISIEIPVEVELEEISIEIPAEAEPEEISVEEGTEEISMDIRQKENSIEGWKRQVTIPMPEIDKNILTKIAFPKIREEREEVRALSEEQKQIFSYFMPVEGMEQQICQALEGTIQRKKNKMSSIAGNVIVIGGKGSGKSVLAMDFIKAIQKETGRSGGKVGKISGAVLNRKDMAKLFKAIAGGYLIIEGAGQLTRETILRLSALMESDTGGLLVIMEDTRVKMEKSLSQDNNFARKFTEKIRIPIFTSDELVNFARVYAKEQECEIDDMGILALYNSISNIQKADEATTLPEVMEIMDQAIERASKGGLKKLFGGKRYTENGYVILKEKDFDN